MDHAPRDVAYRELLLEPLRRSASYTPKMGRREPVALADFTEMYGADPLYSWFGLDSPLMYAAHRAAGAMTSLYRQLGIGCERLWRQLLRDQLGLSEEQSTWSYQTPSSAGAQRTLSLDARIDQRDVIAQTDLARVQEWLVRAQALLEIETPITGVVFEIRQGYKSKDSKRQNADIDNASHALKNSYIPAATILSMQIDQDIQLRYRQNNWIVLVGDPSEKDPTLSAYAFAESILDFNLVEFFTRNTGPIKNEVHSILTRILEPR